MTQNERMVAPGDAIPMESGGLRLAKVVGVFAIMASALSQEYGSGINFVLVNSLGSYPAVASAVPFAMLVAGLLLIPKVGLFARFSQVAPRAGSSYVWLTRTATFPLDSSSPLSGLSALSPPWASSPTRSRPSWPAY